MPGANSADIGFEQEKWKAADILRGNMDAAEYKHVVLGLIFLKYLSDKFDERYRQLKADNNDVEDKDAYAEVNVFFVPSTGGILPDSKKGQEHPKFRRTIWNIANGLRDSKITDEEICHARKHDFFRRRR
jgi:type I restriction-modification system DNA methylase subunit